MRGEREYMGELKEISNWIWESNLLPMIQELAQVSEYELSGTDIVAIAYGLFRTNGDVQPTTFFEYSFLGKHLIEISLAEDPGTDVLQVRLVAPEHLANRLEFMLDLMNQYRFEFDPA